MNKREMIDISDREKALRFMLPYYFHHMPELGKHIYLPCNRDYKPIGVRGYSEWVDYADYKHLMVKFSRDPRLIKGVWKEHSWGLFMYGDLPSSRSCYYQNLAKIMSKCKVFIKESEYDYSDRKR